MPIESATNSSEFYTPTAEVSSKGVKQYRYPIFLGSTSESTKMVMVPECIHFTAVKQGGISFQKQADNSAALAAKESEKRNIAPLSKKAYKAMIGWQPGDKSANQSQQEMKAGIAQSDADKGEKSSVVGTDKETLASKGMRIVGKFFKGQMKEIRTPPKNLEHAFLYMPGALTYSEGATWGAESLGALGNMINEGVRGKGSVGDILKNFGGGAATAVGTAAAVGAGAAAAGCVTDAAAWPLHRRSAGARR